MADVFDITAMAVRGVEEVSDVSQMIFKAITEDKKVGELYSVISGIEFDRRIPIIGTLTDIMETKSGSCSFPEGGEVIVSEKTWTPKTALQEQRLCKDATESKFQFWQSNNANLVERYDLTNSGELNYLIYLVVDAMEKAVVRIADFADTTASLVSGGGKITTAEGASGVARMNTIDGFWVQLFAIATATPAQRVTITENGLGSYALQVALASDTAKNAFESMVLDATDEVQDDAEIHCTKSLFNNYFKWLADNSFDTAMSVSEMGYRTIELALYGVKIVERKDWDRNIKKYFDNGTTWDLPHRAVYTSKSNMLVGLATTENSFSSHYSEDLLVNIVREEVRIDAKVAIDEAVMVAY